MLFSFHSVIRYVAYGNLYLRTCAYHARNGLLVVFVPHECLGGHVSLGRDLHLFLGAVEVLLLQVILEPIVLIPACNVNDLVGLVMHLPLNRRTHVHMFASQQLKS